MSRRSTGLALATLLGTAGWLLAAGQVWRSDGALTSFARVDGA